MDFSLINELAELCGILPGYYDINGRFHTTPPETKVFILKAMGYDLSSSDAIKNSIEQKRLYPWLSFVEPVYVYTLEEQPPRIFLYVPAEEGLEPHISISISIFNEKRTPIHASRISPIRLEERNINGRRYIKTAYECREIVEPGYYNAEIEISHPDKSYDGLKKRTRLILSPGYSYLPDELLEGRCWGLAVNLYAIRSRYNWGVGDFGDLERIISWISGLGGDLVGINPLHAIPNSMPYGVSPYAPLSRLYKNPIYLNMNIYDTGLINKSDLKRLRDGDLIDYEGVYSLKLSVLRRVFTDFLKNHYIKETEEAKSFKSFIAKEGSDLELFALYLALSEYFKTTDWQRWPSEYHDPEGISVKRFYEDHRDDILFFQYIQWLIDSQHRGLHALSKKEGLLIGLYHDLAIGAVRGSSDVWSNQEIFCTEIDLGAPPDDFSPDGQNWGFPPYSPERLRKQGYEFFIKTLRKNMQYAGALRIDHALGLFRQFWIPHGMSPSDGAYVRFPHEDLLKIVSLESFRNNTVIVAEDLGTIGENVRESLKRYRMLSYRLFYFERRYPDPSFLEPSNYPELSLSAITTHDLPTLRGFWKGVDINQRRVLGKYKDDATWRNEIAKRDKDRLLIIEALKKERLIPEDYSVPDELSDELCLAIYAYIARTPSRIVIVSLDDIIGTLNQQNMPGTVDSYPNWRQKTGPFLEDILNDRRFQRLSEIFKIMRGSLLSKTNQIEQPLNNS